MKTTHQLKYVFVKYVCAVYSSYTSNYRQSPLEATLKASTHLLANFMKRLSTISHDSLSGLRVAVSLCLYSIHSLVLHNRTRSSTQIPGQTMRKIRTDISIWVVKQFPIALQVVPQQSSMGELHVSY